MNAWLNAFRLRTLPLALSSIGMGSFLAAFYHSFRWEVALLASVTTIFLQILSNLANDYGDSIHGADSAERVGPQRTVQSGAISKTAMKRAMIIFILLSLISGISLLLISLTIDTKFLIFLSLGILSIVAAIKYTAGSNPYGYAGLGDVSVFVFFGFIGVGGTFFLHTGYFNSYVLLPAASCGLFSIGVLNLNNMRDIVSDQLAGKKSIPVRIGLAQAKKYHYTILSIGLLAAIVFTVLNYQSIYQFLFLITTPLLIRNMRAVAQGEGATLDPLLKQMALSTLLFVSTFGIGLLIHF